MKDRYLTFTHLSREQSPLLENSLQDEFGTIFGQLMGEKGLYQNVRVDEAFFKKFGNDQYPAQSLFAEFQKRPVYPVSRSDEASEAGPPGLYACSGRPLGTPHDEFPLAFYLPTVKTACGQCNAERLFLSLPTIEQRLFASPYKALTERTKQAYTLDYKCGECRNQVITFLVLRKGLAFQLVGRTDPYRPPIDKSVPKEILPIYRDAVQASAEGDLAGAYYHLRTAIEFYTKGLIPTFQLPATK